MIFSLDLPSEPYWLDLPLDVRLKVRPLSAAILSSANAYATRQVIALMAERAERLRLNVPADDLADTDDPDIRRGLLDEYGAVALARFGILAWEGVGADAASPAECTAENRERLGRTTMGLTFLQRYQAPFEKVAAEGNASAPTPPGGSAAAPTTAAAAPTTLPAAPAPAQAG